MDDKEMEKLLAKYKDFEVAVTITVGELVDTAAMALVGVGVTGETPATKGAVDFLKGVEAILAQLVEAEETGQEIVSL